MNRTLLGGGAALVLALTGVSGTAAAATTTCAGANLTPTGENLAQIRSAITCLVNVERVAHGLPLVRTTAVLRDAAARHSADMVHRGYFSHDTPSGVDFRARLWRAGIRTALVGENIAWGLGDQGTPAGVVAGWMQSPSHRANILRRRFTRTGIGIVLGSPGHPDASTMATFTQVFAGR